jgi:hypothetical protein
VVSLCGESSGAIGRDLGTAKHTLVGVLQQHGLVVALCLSIPQDKLLVKSLTSLILLYVSAFNTCNLCLPLPL